MKGTRLLGRLKYFYSIALLIAIWEATTRAGFVDPFLLPGFSAVVGRGYEEIANGTIFAMAGPTLYRTLLGFSLAAVIGVGIGAGMAVSRAMRWFWEPVVSFFFPVPKIAFMPIFVLWFGVFDVSKIAMTTVVSIVPIISATYLGTKGIDRYLMWSAAGMGTTPSRMFWKVVIPGAMPSILSGLQIAMPLCLIVAVVTEMITGGRGLGGYMIYAARFGESDKVFFGIIAITACGFLLIEAVRQLRRAVLPWHAEAAGG